MNRFLICTAALFALNSSTIAGELDQESAPKASAALKPTGPAAVKGTELDKESPTPAHHWHGGWGGFHHHGWGYRPFFGGFYTPYYSSFRTFGGWGYRSFARSYFTPFFGGYYRVGFNPFGFYNYGFYW